MDFCHLHTHDQYSLLDGFGKAQSYAKRAKELGFEYLGLTNHGNVDGLIKFQNACKEVDIKPILGCECYIVPDAKVKKKGEKRAHIVLLVKDEVGWQNLLQLLTYANIEGFYHRPRIDYEKLYDHLEGLVVLTGCTSSFLFEKEGEEIFSNLYDLIREDLYLEIMPHLLKEQAEINEKCRKLSRRYGLPLVATNDCHYILEEDAKVQEVLLAIQFKAKWKDPNRRKFSIIGLHLRTVEEMERAFRFQASLPRRMSLLAMKNSVVVAEKCSDFEIEKLGVHLPKVFGYESWDDTELLKKLCDDGMKQKIVGRVKNIREHKRRYKEEFDTITDLGFARYFLIVWELIKWCKENDIMTGPGRGSVGGCLIAYLLGITAVDPLKFGLIFSRFISPARIDLPDIDMDFEDVKRNKVREHLEDLYGKENVAGVSTFLSLKGRGALRDVSRAFDLPLADVDAASKSIVVRSGGDFRADFTIEDAFNTFEDGKKFKAKYPDVTNLAIKLEGQVRGGGMHAAGIVVSKENLYEGRRGNLCLRKGDVSVINWDKEDTEYMGLMKLDVLGLNALTILNGIRKAVKVNHGVDLDYESLPLDDVEVYKQFTLGNNIGCFQFGSLGLRKYCQEVGLEEFEDLVATNALYRPGTLRSGMTAEYTRRKHGQSKWKYIHPFLEKLTKETYGIIVYQEQVMRFMHDLGGLGWKTADTVRKVISKSKGVEQFQKFKKVFVEGCKERNTLEPKMAAKVWDELANFGSYGFNKAHAVEYSLIAYWQMYCKVHYSAEFICCSLSCGSEGKTEDLVEEAKRLGLELMLPKVGKSKPSEWVAEDNKLYIPFLEIKGVGQRAVQKLEAAGAGNLNYSQAALGTKMIELLERVGAFVSDDALDEGQREEIAHLFSFGISRDPMGRYRGLYDLLSKSLDFKRIVDLDFGKSNKKYGLYFGQMTEVKYGYRGKLDTLDKRMGLSGMAGALGGVYGNLKDDTDFCMLVFDGNIYSKKKDRIEHCGGEWLIASCNHPLLTTSVMCGDAWLGEELIEGELEGLDLKLAGEVAVTENRRLPYCQACDLRKGCSAPVSFSVGQYNIMIIGEAPGREEDRLGEGFVGLAGRLLWSCLRKRSLFRQMFYVDNVIKCWPKDVKTPHKRHIKTCSKWLKTEIERIKPFLILAFGNTCVSFFEGRDSGIMEMNGITKWNPEYNAWVCWSIHPAAVLYHSENQKLLDEGLDNFQRKLRILGGVKK